MSPNHSDQVKYILARCWLVMETVRSSLFKADASGSVGDSPHLQYIGEVFFHVFFIVLGQNLGDHPRQKSDHENGLPSSENFHLSPL